MSENSEAGGDTTLNKARYEKFWQNYQLDDPKQWAHWSILKDYLGPGVKALEIGSGPRPRINMEGGYFVELDNASLEKLHKAGGQSVNADVNLPLPFAANSMDVICAFEVLEHLDKQKNLDQEAIKEMARVIKLDGHAFVSVPLHQRLFNEYDVVAGHTIRYESGDMEKLFADNGFSIEKFAPIDLPWPGPTTAKLLAFTERKLPWVIPSMTKVLDSLPFGFLKQPIKLQPWNKDLSPRILDPVSTGFFVLKPLKAS